MRSLYVSLLLLSLIFGQARIGGWDSYTSTLNVNQIVEFDNLLIGATEGGLLLYDKNTAIFASLNNIDGLVSTKLNCLELGTSGHIWIGGGEPNGFVQIYDIINQSSISEFKYEMSEIIDFAVSDSLVYAIFRDNNDYGIIEFNYLNDEFIHKDIYPNWPMGNRINEIEIYGNHVFVATEIGLFMGEVGSDPNNWQILLTELEESVSSLFIKGDDLYSYINNKLYEYDILTNTIIEIATIDDNSINDISVLESGEFILLGERNYYLIDNGIIDQIPFTKNTINSIYGLASSEAAFATTTGLAFLEHNNSLEYKLPNSPHQNNLQAITVLDDGRIVAGGGNGISIKESEGWRNIVESDSEVKIQNDKNYDYFIADSIPADFGASISKMVQGSDGLLYCAIEGTNQSQNGGGIIIIDIDNPTNFTLIDTSFLDYFSTEYMIVKDINFDRNGNLWIADAFATNKHEPVHVKSLDRKWKSYRAEDSMNSIGLTPSTLAIDSWQRIWVGSFQNSERNAGFPDGGLAMLSYDGQPAQPDDFQWYKIDINNSNSNSTIWSLAITPENRLYMLTPIGLTFFDLQFSDNDPIKYESPRYYFPNISFGQESEIRLDAKGNAWTVSGSDGIHVLLSNSTFWPDDNENINVESINLDTYPILSDNVTDIDFDDKNGIAYISTIRGINSFKTPFAESKENYSDLRVFPSPFHVPSDKPLIIDNLKDNSSLKVMTITGKVIRSINSSESVINGYQLMWDGKDEDGKWVNSGVYLLSVYTEEGSNKFEKVVVIRN